MECFPWPETSAWAPYSFSSHLVLATLCPRRCPSPVKAGQLRLAESFSNLPGDTQLTDEPDFDLILEPTVPQRQPYKTQDGVLDCAIIACFRETQVHADQNSISRKITRQQAAKGGVHPPITDASRNLFFISSACHLCWNGKFLKLSNFPVREFFGFVFYFFPLTALFEYLGPASPHPLAILYFRTQSRVCRR